MRYLSLILFALILQGCGRYSKFTEFNLPYDNTVVVPSTAILNLPINLPTPDFTTNCENSFEQNNTNTDLIESIYLNVLELTITDPAHGNFNFLKSTTLYLSSPNLPEIKVAWKESIPSDNSIKLLLDLSSENLINYLKSDLIKLKLITISDELITSDYQVEIHSVFHVRAKLFTI